MPALSAPASIGATSGNTIRVGYITGDLGRNHPVAQFVRPLLATNAAAGLHQTIYFDREGGTVAAADAPAGVAVKPTGKCDDEELSRLVRGDGITHLIDLSGHTAGHRLNVFALRPAPVSASMIGYPYTTGSPHIDWLMTDRIMHPPGEGHLTERAAYLPGSFLCFRPPPAMPQVGASGPPRDGPVTFGSLNHLPKLSDTTLRLWSRVMAAVPDARLLVKCRSFAEAPAATLFAARCTDHGIDSARLVLEGPEPFGDAMQAYRRMDIALDALPYSGGTTTAHALWMGVPVVTMRGTRTCGRTTASLLTAAGKSDWIAGDTDQFVNIAATLAAQPETRHDLHCHVAASAMCDIDRYAAAVRERFAMMLAQSG